MRKRSITKQPRGSGPSTPTDWSEFDAQTDEDIAAAVESDPDAAPLITPAWLSRARVVHAPEKVPISIRIDKDVLEHFKSQPRYQTRINAILRMVMDEEKRAQR